MTSFSNGAQPHPALEESRRRLATLERRTPPGYPLGYRLHIHVTTCSGCGSVSRQSLLWTVVRAGASDKAYHPTGAKERLYNLPVDEVFKHFLTPRCEACIGLLPREPVPAMPAYGQKIGIRGVNHPPTKGTKVSGHELAELLEGLDLSDL